MACCGESTTSDRGWPIPLSCLSWGHNAPHGKSHMRGVLVRSRAVGGCGSLTALSGPRGEGGPSSGPCFKGAPETSIIKMNILVQILKNQTSMQKILMSKMPNFQRKRAQVLLICSLVSGLCWLPLRASQQAARARRGRRGLLAMCTPLWSVPAAQRAHFLSGSREASAWFQGHPKGFRFCCQARPDPALHPREMLSPKQAIWPGAVSNFKIVPSRLAGAVSTAGFQKESILVAL